MIFQPTRYSLRVCAKAGKLKAARELFCNFNAKGLQPRANTYNTTIDGLCHEGLLDEANELLFKMEENGCSPDNVTFDLIVQGKKKGRKKEKRVSSEVGPADKLIDIPVQHETQELLVLGWQTLAELRDSIYSLTDEMMHKAGQYGPSGYFLTEGECKHVIVIRDMRLIHPEDVQNRAAYPVLAFQVKIRLHKCHVCKIYRATKVTANDK
ncbi:hypothetical protein HHK36_011937 [Tetracentron sinense]|uniref:Pentatricopeptide repeat-containing protein n=1 Tax=Tetracentron sinense TaxID=13715 RepID=A0A835DHQ9_TETSI|nr:hypothetical protein HHK36_011937 [Tetracentron sinense]